MFLKFNKRLSETKLQEDGGGHSTLKLYNFNSINILRMINDRLRKES